MAQATLATLAQAGIERPKDASGALQAIPATLDNGYYSEAAVQALETLGFDPYIATTRQRHHAPQTEVPETPATATGAHGRESADAGREGVVRQAQGHRGAGVWPDQGSAWFPSLLAARLGSTSVANGVWSA